MSVKLNVDMAEVARYMRMGGTLPEGALAERVEALMDEADKVTRPARVFLRLPFKGGAIGAGAGAIPVAGTLAAHLSGCRSAYLVCGTLGAGMDALQRRVSARSGTDALIVQAIGAALIETWMDSVEGEIRGQLARGESLVPRYSPGYGDFPLSAQRAILALLDAPRAVGVSLTDGLLMAPSKSVSAVIGVKCQEDQVE